MKRFLLLACITITTGFLFEGCSTAPRKSQDDEKQAEAVSTGNGDELNIKAWPLIVSSTSRDGSKTVWATPFYHHKSRNGKIESFHLLNYLYGETYWSFLPFIYHGGEPGKKHTGIIPFYFVGPGYQVFPFAYSIDTKKGSYTGIIPLFLMGPESWFLPALLSASWKNERGGHTTWVTPLFEYSSNERGNSKVSLVGFVPLFYHTQDSMFFTLLMCGKWNHEDGSQATWVTPFFHLGVAQN